MKRKKLLSIVLAIVLFCSSVTSFAATYVSDGSVVSVKTPTSASETGLSWSVQFGTSYKDAPSTMIVIEDTVIVMSRKTLYKLNAKTGKVIKSVEMADMPSHGYTSPTYADGVIYCPLDNATVQAFNYKTMKSMWIYKDALGGQSLTPITYDDGCIYTGFWNDEDVYANYVCIDVKDEKKADTSESKTAKWTYKSLGGFYWAGCTISGSYVVFGCDDGTVYDNRPSKVMSLDKTTGKTVDTIAITGDQRSSIAQSDGQLYFVTKAGYLYSVKLGSDGSFNDSSLKKLSLGGASTSTPVVCNGRLYVGVQGAGFGKGYIKVIDSSSMNIIYSAAVNGYPQNKVLVSDAYYKDTGKLYIYTTYNAAPGGITMLTDSVGQTSAVTEEIFTPETSKRDYCISTIAASEDGTLYYKNDSGYIFALKNTSNKISFFAKIFSAIINFFKGLFS